MEKFSGSYAVTLLASKEGKRDIRAPYVYPDVAEIDANKLRVMGYEAIIRPFEEEDRMDLTKARP